MAGTHAASPASLHLLPSPPLFLFFSAPFFSMSSATTSLSSLGYDRSSGDDIKVPSVLLGSERWPRGKALKRESWARRHREGVANERPARIAPE